MVHNSSMSSADHFCCGIHDGADVGDTVGKGMVGGLVGEVVGDNVQIALTRSCIISQSSLITLFV
jgi:hypothetical protein